MEGTLKYLRSEDYSRLLHTLANKFAGEQQDTINIARKTLVDVSSIAFEPRADHTWDSILSIADEQGKILQLLDNAIEVVNGSLELEALKEGLKQQLENIKNSLHYDTLLQVKQNTEQHDLPVVLMICSKDDEKECAELKKQFGALRDLCVLYEYPGTFSNEENEKRLSAAGIILAMVSPGFFSGEAVNYVRQLAGTDRVIIPVLLKTCLWNRLKVLSSRVPVPVDGETFIMEYANPETGFAAVAGAVAQILENNLTNTQ